MRRLVQAGLTILLAAGLTGCGGSTARTVSSGVESLRVVATTTQLADFARNVGGDRIQLTQLLKPNVDPHEYEPTPSAAEAVANAKVVLRSGAGLDDWITKIRTGAGGAATVVTTTDDVALRGDDPHVWMDTRNAEVMVESIRDALSTADPAGARIYDTNAARYNASLRALDRELRNLISAVPRSKRTLVTDHDAFGYFAPRYGIRIVGAAIGSLSTSAEPDARHLAELVRTIQRQHVAVSCRRNDDVAVNFRQRAIFHRVGRELVDGQSNRRRAVIINFQVFAFHDNIAGSKRRIGREQLTNHLVQHGILETRR